LRIAIGRHATASSAQVELAVTGTAVRLTVRGDGVGLPEQRHDSGLGNLNKRGEELGWLARRRSEQFDLGVRPTHGRGGL
jgi:signal transduction histidine kinase